LALNNTENNRNKAKNQTSLLGLALPIYHILGIFFLRLPWDKSRVVLNPKYASDFLMQAQTWADVVLVVGSSSAQLINAVREWSKESKQLLVQLLSSHLETEPDAFEQIDWLPKKLLGRALSSLSFTVQRIKKSDNLVDEPEIEYISGCQFNSLSNLGTRHEQWVFHFEGNLIPAFGHDEFSVEKF